MTFSPSSNFHRTTVDENGSSTNFTSSSTHYYPSDKFYCQQFYCSKNPFYDNWHVFSYVVTPYQTSMFIDGILVGTVRDLGGTDTESLCPLNILHDPSPNSQVTNFNALSCYRDPVIILGLLLENTQSINDPNISSSGIQKLLAMRQALKSTLDQKGTVELKVDYVKKYNFDYPPFVNWSFTDRKDPQKYVSTFEPIDIANVGSTQLKVQRGVLGKNNTYYYVKPDGKIVQIRDIDTNSPIAYNIQPVGGWTNATLVDGDIVVADGTYTDNIYYRSKEGKLIQLYLNSSEQWTSVLINSAQQNRFKIKETDYRDMAVIKTYNNNQIFYRTINDRIAYAEYSGGNWNLSILGNASPSHAIVTGDIALGEIVNGKPSLFYTGCDITNTSGTCTLRKVFGYENISPSNSTYISVSQSGMQSEVANVYGAITVGVNNQIYYINNLDNRIKNYRKVNGNYVTAWINGSNSAECEKAYGALTKSYDANRGNYRLFYRGVNNHILSFKWEETWYHDFIIAPSTSLQERMLGAGNNHYDLIAEDGQIVYYIDKNYELKKYQLSEQPIPVIQSDDDYTHFTDEINGCIGSSKTHQYKREEITQDEIVEIEEIIEPSFRYNMVYDELLISYQNEDLSNVSYSIFDITGRNVLSNRRMTNVEERISTNDFATGTYIVHFIYKKQQKAFKFIKM